MFVAELKFSWGPKKTSCNWKNRPDFQPCWDRLDRSQQFVMDPSGTSSSQRTIELMKTDANEGQLDVPKSDPHMGVS